MSSTSGTLTTSERAARNRAILARRLAGESFADLAEAFGLSTRQVQRACDDARGYSVAELRADPESIASRVLEAHLKALDRLEDLAGSRNDAVAVAAARAAPNAASSLAAVAQNFGITPSTGWRFLSDSRPALRLILSAAERAGVPKAALREALEREMAVSGPTVLATSRGRSTVSPSTVEESAVFRVEAALIDVLPIGTRSVGLAVAIGDWLRSLDLPDRDLLNLATTVRRFPPMT